MISVLMPLRNGDKPLAIPGLQAQTYSDFELILEDGPDSPASPMDKRNRAARRAGGDYFALVDADTTLFPRTLELWLAALLDDPGASWAWSTFDRYGSLTGIQEPVPIREDGPELYTGGICLIRREAWVEVPEDRDPRLADKAWFRILVAAGARGVQVPGPAFLCYFKPGDISTP